MPPEFDTPLKLSTRCRSQQLPRLSDVSGEQIAAPLHQAQQKTVLAPHTLQCSRKRPGFSHVVAVAEAAARENEDGAKANPNQLQPGGSWCGP